MTNNDGPVRFGDSALTDRPRRAGTDARPIPAVAADAINNNTDRLGHQRFEGEIRPADLAANKGLR